MYSHCHTRCTIVAQETATCTAAIHNFDGAVTRLAIIGVILLLCVVGHYEHIIIIIILIGPSHDNHWMMRVPDV